MYRVGLAALACALCTTAARGQFTLEFDNGAAAHTATEFVVNTPIVVTRGGDVPADLHDPRTPGGALGTTRSILRVGAGVNTAAVETANYGTANSYGVAVRDRHIYGGQIINTPQQTFHNGEAAVADGIRLFGHSNSVDNVWLENFKGNGVVLGCLPYTGTGSEPQNIPTLPGSYIRDTWVYRCFGGLVVSAVDSEVNQCKVASIRDYGLWAKAGNIRVSNSHLYGCGLAAVRLGVDATTGASKMDDCDFSDSPIGCQIVVPHCRISDCYSQGCKTNVSVEASGARITGTTIQLSSNAQVNSGQQIVGVDFVANTPAGCFKDGSVIVSVNGIATDSPAIGVRVRSHLIDVNGAFTGNAGTSQRALVLDSVDANGSNIDATVSGFYGTDSYAIEIVTWGAGNTIKIRASTFEVGQGKLVKVSAANYPVNSTNNIYINGALLPKGVGYGQ